MHKKIKATVVFLFLAFSLVAQSSDWYKGKPIKRIDFEGLVSVSETSLNTILQPYKGKNFTDDIYYEILQKLYELDYFTEIEPQIVPADSDYTSINLTFKVKERASVAGYKFIGNSRIRSADLLSKIVLKKGDIYDEAKALKDEKTVQEYYRLNGYATSVVKSTAVEDTDLNTVTITYEISEGKQTVVKAILFEGVSQIPERKIKKVLASREAGIIEKGAYKESNLEQDKLAISDIYGQKGYVKAFVETIKKDVDTETDPDRNNITLTYVISEGDEYTYAGTTFVGNKIFKTEELASQMDLKVGDILDMTKFAQSFYKVSDLYYKNGYMSTFLDSKKAIDPINKTVSFTIIISERERSHIENIIIKGNKKTKTEVILREILLKPGDVFSRQKFFDSMRNLANLRYFSSVVHDFQPGSEENLINIIFTVEEQNTADINFGLTFSGTSDANTFPISFFLKWNEKNLAGRGSILDAGFNISPNEQSLNAGYTENWFLGTPLSVGFNASVTHKKETAFQDVLYPFGIPDPFTDPNIGNYDLAKAYSMKYHRWEIATGAHTGYRWFPRYAMITLSSGINFRLVKNVYDRELFRPFDPVVRNENEHWRFSNALWGKASFDARDFIHDPFQGWFISEQVSFFGLFPKVESEYFFRSETKAEGYVKLLDYPVSEIWNLKFGLAFYSGFSFQVPLTKAPISLNSKLMIDGMMVGRGWQALGQAGLGDVLLDHWVEFRMPLAHGILSFDFFFEAAAVKPTIQDLKSLSINDYYFSFGPGLRFSLPQFPLRLMFANTFRSDKGKPYWGNGKGADWKFVLSFNIPNL